MNVESKQQLEGGFRREAELSDAPFSKIVCLPRLLDRLRGIEPAFVGTVPAAGSRLLLLSSKRIENSFSSRNVIAADENSPNGRASLGGRCCLPRHCPSLLNPSDTFNRRKASRPIGAATSFRI